MKLRNSCDICQAEHLAEIDLEWEYELNAFVFRSLEKHRGLPVLWTLGYLQDRGHTQPFWYLPEVELFAGDERFLTVIPVGVEKVRVGMRAEIVAVFPQAFDDLTVCPGAIETTGQEKRRLDIVFGESVGDHGPTLCKLVTCEDERHFL